jgi:hypothetical protein
MNSDTSASRAISSGLRYWSSEPTRRIVLGGFGGMVGVELAGGGRAAERLLRALRLITHAPSLGGVESLVSEPRFTSHAGLTADEFMKITTYMRLVGVPPQPEMVAGAAGGCHGRGGRGALCLPRGR